jgi:phosphoglycolate phosphatase-like HAD superfamily hydrolase
MSRTRDYFELRTGGSVSYVRYDSVERLADIGGIVLDCDGVLIDEGSSYDLAVREAVSKITSMLTGLEVKTEDIPVELIYTVRSIGSFNNDWDTTYLLATALTSHITTEKSLDIRSRLDKILAGDFLDLDVEPGWEGGDALKIWMKELDALLGQLETTALSPREVLTKILPPDLYRISEEVTQALRYPGKYGESLVVTVFDEIYYGSENMPSLRGVGPFFKYPGRVNDERLLVREETLRRLREIGGKLCLSTGRGSWETYKTLGGLTEYLEKTACIFIGDLVAANPLDRGKYEKPNPWPLREAANLLKTDGNILYVGNSMEDLLMWENANKLENRYLFAGIFSGARGLDMLDLYIERGADLAVSSINILPRILDYLKID